MFFIHILFVMLMTGDTGEHSIVCGIRMAFTAGIPFTTMFTGINREVLTVMIEIGIPVVGSMTDFASRREHCRLMVGRSAQIIFFMAEETVGRCPGILSVDMTFTAGYENMRACQWK